MFVPFCCTGLANIRRYLDDGSGTVLAERANEFAYFIESINSPLAYAYTLFRAGHLYVSYLCGGREDTPLGNQNSATRFVAVKRYTPDLSEEVSYEIEASTAYTAAYGAWTVDDALLQNRQDHFTVDSSGNVIAAIQGGVDNGIAATTYKWHVRSWNPNGTLRWVANNPASPAADQSAIIGVHAVGGNGKFWVVYAQRVAGSITPEDPTPSEQIEVLAARYSSAGVKETTLSLAVLNKILTPEALQNDVFYNVSFEQNLHRLFYSHSNGVSIAVCSAGLRYTPADDTVTYNKHFRCAVITGETAAYTWFRLLRPATGGSTSQLNGYTAQNGSDFGGVSGDVTRVNEISAIMMPRTDKGNVQSGIWIRVGTFTGSSVVSYADYATWWNYALDGTYLRDYPTQEPLNPVTGPGGSFFGFQTGQSIKAILPTGGIPPISHGASRATPVGHDQNAAWYFVRHTWEADASGEQRHYGTVLHLRDNASLVWETPAYDVNLDGNNRPVVPPSRISIAVPGPDDLTYGGYYLVGAGAF